MKLTHASLFSGIGGAELAASWLGWTNVFHCEIQEFQRKVLEYWFPNSISYEDITKTDFKEWRGQIDILTGGFPCQPFSVAGKRKGAEDNRYLWGEMLRAIRQIQPTWVVGENVNGILSMVQPGTETKMGRTDDLLEENYIYKKEQQFTIDAICEDLESAGYSVQPIVIPACAVGAPHRRDRVWIAAHRTNAGVKDLQQEGKTEFLNLQLLPTPNASEGTKWTTTYNPSRQMGRGLTARACAGILPTPVASDAQGGACKQLIGGKKYRKSGESFSASLKDLAVSEASQNPSSTSSQLNPLYVTEMMGYPLEWLILPFLSQSGEVKASKR